MDEPIVILEKFVGRLAKLKIYVKLRANYPWIYISRINDKRVTETFQGKHGFTIAFYPMRHNEALRFTDIGKIFELIRKYR